jgi:hypothetical protein
MKSRCNFEEKTTTDDLILKSLDGCLILSNQSCWISLQIALLIKRFIKSTLDMDTLHAHIYYLQLKLSLQMHWWMRCECKRVKRFLILLKACQIEINQIACENVARKKMFIYMIIKNKIYWKLSVSSLFMFLCCCDGCVVFDVRINVLLIIITYYLRESIKFLMDSLSIFTALNSQSFCLVVLLLNMVIIF